MPYFVIDIDVLKENLRTLHALKDDTGCHILLAQKCFSCYALYPLMSQYLSGATASGLFEAQLMHEFWPGGENHIFSPAYRAEDMTQILGLCDHIVFNSRQQYELWSRQAKDRGLDVGLRVNPECSTQETEHAIYDPCAPGSRLGARQMELKEYPIDMWPDLDGLHFHTLCEQDADALEITLNAVEERFGAFLKHVKWINFGGGHHITRPGYDLPLLKSLIRKMQERYHLKVYLEPGEAVALNAGELHCKVLEIQPMGKDGVANVIVDTSAACHMPDVLEMPYTPPLEGAEPWISESAPLSGYLYRLGGATCLSGDIIGTYHFEEKLRNGQELVFKDMAIYSMVKTNTFNGMPLPDIYLREQGETRLWKRFSYDDFKSRL